MTPKSRVLRIRCTESCLRASRGGIRSPAESWQDAQRRWYTASPEICGAAESGALRIRMLIKVKKTVLENMVVLYSQAYSGLSSFELSGYCAPIPRLSKAGWLRHHRDGPVP